jgi:amino acid transporter
LEALLPGNGLWRTKSAEQSIADTDEPDTKLRRDLSAWDLTVFGVAVVIGAGTFTLTARTAGDFAGPSVALAFVPEAAPVSATTSTGVDQSLFSLLAGGSTSMYGIFGKTLATAFSANGVDWAANVISIGALAGLTTVVMVLMPGQTRVLFAMSRDGLLPRGLSKTGSRGTPGQATLLVTILVAGDDHRRGGLLRLQPAELVAGKTE